MNLLLTYPSALEFWLNPNHDVEKYEYLSNDVVLMDFFDTKGAEMDNYEDVAQAYRVSMPIHTLVSNHSQRRDRDQRIFHIAKNPLPSRSVIRVKRELYVISPELCFILAARSMPFAELVRLGFELCAKYRKDPLDPQLQVSVTPVTNVSRLNKYLNSASGINGVKLAKRAVKYVLDNSNSYMETNLALLGSLPISEGGYGLPRPILNHVIKLTQAGAEFLGRNTCEADEVWLERKVALEYDSTFYHLERDQFMLDKKRSTAMALSGFKVLNVTANNVKSFADIEKLFFTIRKALKCCARTEEFNRAFNLRWIVVHQIMFDHVPDV